LILKKDINGMNLVIGEDVWVTARPESIEIV
jgi:hypothetical protein